MAHVPPDTGPVDVIGASPAADALRRRLTAAGVSVALPDDRAKFAVLPAGATAIVTLLPNEARLRATLEACAAARERSLTVLDLSPVTAATQRDLDAAFRAAGVAVVGGRLLTRFRDGVARATLYVDDEALHAPALREVLVALADDLVPTGGGGRAKALGLVDDLLAGVNAAAVGEALALGQRAGLAAPTLTALLQKGSGATAVMAYADATDMGPAAHSRALAHVARAAQQADHSLLFGSVAIGALVAQSQFVRELRAIR